MVNAYIGHAEGGEVKPVSERAANFKPKGTQAAMVLVCTKKP